MKALFRRHDLVTLTASARRAMAVEVVGDAKAWSEEEIRELAVDGFDGVLVPGIIANELERQGAVKSLMSLAVVVGILALIMMGMGMQVFRV